MLRDDFSSAWQVHDALAKFYWLIEANFLHGATNQWHYPDPGHQWGILSLVPKSSLGSLRNDDGDGYENVT